MVPEFDEVAVGFCFLDLRGKRQEVRGRVDDQLITREWAESGDGTWGWFYDIYPQSRWDKQSCRFQIATMQ